AVGKTTGNDEHLIIQQVAFAANQLVDVNNFRHSTRQFAGQRSVMIAVATVGVQYQGVRLSGSNAGSETRCCSIDWNCVNGFTCRCWNFTSPAMLEFTN